MESCKQRESTVSYWLLPLSAAAGALLLVFVPSGVWLRVSETAAVNLQLGAYLLKQFLTVLLLLVVPALWARTAQTVSPWMLLFLSGMSIGFGMILFADFRAAIYAAMPVVIPGVGLYALQRVKLSNFRTVLYESFLVLTGLFGLVCLPDLVANGDAYLEVRRVAGLYAQATDALIGTSASAEGTAADFVRALRDLIDSYRVNADLICVPILMGPAMAAGLSATLLSHRLNRRGGADLSPLPRFEDWRCERWYVLGAAAFALVSNLARFSGSQTAEAIAGVAQVAQLLPCSLAGLAAVRRISRRANRNWPFAAACAGLLLLPGFIMNLLTILGILSSLIIRKNVGEDGVRK